jgi:2-carboxy-1,4-naphthoquinone phytyltransferase
MSPSPLATAPTTGATPSRQQLWWAALKLPMYTVAVVPIGLGTIAAGTATRQWHGSIAALFMVGAIAIVAWINISNDVFDSDTGIDRAKAESVVNLTGNRNLMLWIGNGLLALGLGAIGAICWLQQDAMVAYVVLLCCFLGYTYQGPPFRLGYLGLGEIICWLCFGPLALGAAYYSQTRAWSWENLTLSVVVGLLTSIILFCSHFHQVADDLAAGKRSPIVRLGTARSALVLRWSLMAVYGCLGIGLGLGILPASLGIAFLGLPLAYQLDRFVQAHHDQPSIVRTCKYLAVRLHFATGLLLSLGAIASLWW